MDTIQGVLDTKGHDVWSIDSDASVYAAIEMMATRHVGALLVVDGGAPVGILSERDYARKVILKGRASRETQVREIMTSPVIFTNPTITVEQAMGIMTEKRIRHLPVREEGQIVGIVSLGDLVKSIIDDQRFTIDQLERYIAGS